NFSAKCISVGLGHSNIADDPIKTMRTHNFESCVARIRLLDRKPDLGQKLFEYISVQGVIINKQKLLGLAFVSNHLGPSTHFGRFRDQIERELHRKFASLSKHAADIDLAPQQVDNFMGN